MSRKFTEHQLELLTAYTDGCTDKAETTEVELLLSSDADYKALFELEKATKKLLSSRLRMIEPPSDSLQNVHKGIDALYEGAKKESADRSSVNTITSTITKPQANFSKYYFFSIAAIVIILAVVSFKVFKLNGSIPDNKNFELVSRQIFNKIEKGDMKVQYATNNPEELQKYFQDKADFKVFIPSIKDAELIGGTINEVEGQKLVHFVHKCKDGKIIYTMQSCKTALMKNDHMMLDEPCLDRVKQGSNWVESKCGNEVIPANMVVWTKDDCICSSVSKEEPKMITSVLTSYK